MRVTLDEIMAKRTPAGGWTWAQFRAWGVPVPPPKGWKQKLIAGVGFGDGEADPAPAIEPEAAPDAPVTTVILDGTPPVHIKADAAFLRFKGRLFIEVDESTEAARDAAAMASFESASFITVGEHYAPSDDDGVPWDEEP